MSSGSVTWRRARSSCGTAPAPSHHRRQCSPRLRARGVRGQPRRQRHRPGRIEAVRSFLLRARASPGGTGRPRGPAGDPITSSFAAHPAAVDGPRSVVGLPGRGRTQRRHGGGWPAGAAYPPGYPAGYAGYGGAWPAPGGNGSPGYGPANYWPPGSGPPNSGPRGYLPSGYPPPPAASQGYPPPGEAPPAGRGRPPPGEAPQPGAATPRARPPDADSQPGETPRPAAAGATPAPADTSFSPPT